jgi:hypothetical protein
MHKQTEKNLLFFLKTSFAYLKPFTSELKVGMYLPEPLKQNRTGE